MDFPVSPEIDLSGILESLNHLTMCFDLLLLFFGFYLGLFLFYLFLKGR